MPLSRISKWQADVTENLKNCQYSRGDIRCENPLWEGEKDVPAYLHLEMQWGRMAGFVYGICVSGVWLCITFGDVTQSQN
ncbi:MAG: hypothetical protein COA36_09335 [Desulfotalea sp.]|nr:MAG: hypothetical protein COA36_09335 [Desulfotalea sp.]